jgi:hypothetical protein
MTALLVVSLLCLVLFVGGLWADRYDERHDR